jgi:hypothetical protein
MAPLSSAHFPLFVTVPLQLSPYEAILSLYLDPGILALLRLTCSILTGYHTATLFIESRLTSALDFTSDNLMTDLLVDSTLSRTHIDLFFQNHTDILNCDPGTAFITNWFALTCVNPQEIGFTLRTNQQNKQFFVVTALKFYFLTILLCHLSDQPEPPISGNTPSLTSDDLAVLTTHFCSICHYITRTKHSFVYPAPFDPLSSGITYASPDDVIHDIYGTMLKTIVDLPLMKFYHLQDSPECSVITRISSLKTHSFCLLPYSKTGYTTYELLYTTTHSLDLSKLITTTSFLANSFSFDDTLTPLSYPDWPLLPREIDDMIRKHLLITAITPPCEHPEFQYYTDGLSRSLLCDVPISYSIQLHDKYNATLTYTGLLCFAYRKNHDLSMHPPEDYTLFKIARLFTVSPSHLLTDPTCSDPRDLLPSHVSASTGERFLRALPNDNHYYARHGFNAIPCSSFEPLLQQRRNSIFHTSLFLHN